MNKNLKIKINGLNIKSLFLINYLSKYSYEFFINDSINLISEFNCKKKFYTITKSTKIILQELNLWEKLERNIYGFNSFSFYNKYFKEEILFFDKNFHSKDYSKENFGWTLDHSYLEKVLFDQLSNMKNIYYLRNEKSDVSHIKYDYELFFGPFNNKNLKRNNILPFHKFDTSTALIFKVMVRGNSSKRAYEIFLKKESILMIPLSNHIYQIIWKRNQIKAKDLININVNFLLDNLSTILPKGFKLDQIVGEVSFSSNTSPIFSNIIIDNSKVYVKDFNQISNHLIKDELKTLIGDLNTLQQKFLFNKNFSKFPFGNTKNNVYLKILFYFSKKLFLKNTFSRVVKEFNVFPYLFIKSPLLRFNNNNRIKNLINSISKPIFFMLIR